MNKSASLIIGYVILIAIVMSSAILMFYYLKDYQNTPQVEAQTSAKVLSQLTLSEITITSESFSNDSSGDDVLNVDLYNSGKQKMYLNSSQISLVIMNRKEDILCPVDTLDYGGAFEGNITLHQLRPGGVLRIPIKIDNSFCSIKPAHVYKYKIVFRNSITSAGEFEATK